MKIQHNEFFHKIKCIKGLYFILGFLSFLGFCGGFLVFKYWKQCIVIGCFFITAVLRYNSHTIKFTLLKCTIHRDVQLLLLSNVRTFLSPSKETTYVPTSSHSPLPPLPSPWQPLIYFLSLWICLFWVFHISGILQYVTFCVWLLSWNVMFSNFIYIIACISTSFLFIVK